MAQANRIEAIEKVLFGNGQPGLKTTVDKLVVTVDSLEKTASSLQTTISAFNKFMIESEIMNREREKRLLRKNNWILATIATATSLIGVIIGKLL